MKKSILITVGMALVLFIYGYLASTAGHDHGSHGQGNGHVEEEQSDHGEHEH